MRPTLLRDLLLDLRFAVRALRRAPLFTLVAVVTLALGIGSTTAVFTVVNGVLIKPLPFHDADSLVSLKHTTNAANPGAPFGMCVSMFVTYARESRAFEHLGVWSRGSENVTDDVSPEEITTLNVSAGVLPAIGVQPATGRWFSEEDHTNGSPETVILTDGYWARRFDRDPAIIGRQIAIDSRPRVVVGVMPAGFRFLDESPDLVLPLRIDTSALTLGGFTFQGVARLAPGVSVEQANIDITRILPLWIDAWPSFPGIDRAEFRDIVAQVRPLKQELVGSVGNMLWLLLGTTVLVLIIACANVANLVLVRAEGRNHDLAIRAALGAGSERLARQLLVESLVLGLLGGGAGLLLAFAGVSALSAVGPASIPRLREITFDPAVFAFTLGLSVSAALIFGSLPLTRFGSKVLAQTLRAGGRGSAEDRDQKRGRDMLVVAQVALALMLLVGSGLMARTFLAMRAVPPGFSDPEHVQLVRINISETQVPEPERVWRMQRDMVERLAAIAGVTDVSFTGHVPMAGEISRSTVVREDMPPADADVKPPVRWFRYVAPDYFKTLGTRLVAGRDFGWADLENRRPVAVISENLAREWWSEPQAAIGRRIRDGKDSPWREIVGVVGDVYEEGVHQPAPSIVYWPAFMESFWGQPVAVRRTATFAIRSAGAGTESLLAQIRDALSSVNANIPPARARTLGDVYARALAATWFALMMLAIAAAMALVLSIIGIYGVIAYTVTQRRREIGIRAALGGSRRALAALFVRRGMALALVGVLCGLAGAAMLTRLMTSLLYGTSPLDPLVYVVVSVGLLSIAAIASYVPARRAARVDPVQTLRGE
jgi:putative ABC transport system permease protein